MTRPYGQFKRGSSKPHPHNECGSCSESNINKKKERRLAKRGLAKMTEPRYDEIYWEGIAWLERNG